MSLYNDLSLDSAMEDGTSKYMLDGNEFIYLTASRFKSHCDFVFFFV